MSALIGAGLLVLSRYFNSQDESNTLVVLSYDSFVGLSGPGPDLVKEFEARCQCRVRLISAGDGGLLLERVVRSGEDGFGDVLLGVDQLMLSALREKVEWASLPLADVDWEETVKPFVESDFAPFDWAPLTFIYREGQINPPGSAREILNPSFDRQVAIEDPRTSSVGLQLLFALSQWFPDDRLFHLDLLKRNIHSVSPSWSTAYGLFQRGQARMVFSYVTSLAYHWKVEKDLGFKAVSFKDGHPVQIEYVAVPANCRSCERAREFVEFLLEPKSQRLIMEKNFMFPALRGVKDGTLFEELPNLKALPSSKALSDSVEVQRLLEVWRKAWQ